MIIQICLHKFAREQSNEKSMEVGDPRMAEMQE